MKIIQIIKMGDYEIVGLSTEGLLYKWIFSLGKWSKYEAETREKDESYKEERIKMGHLPSCAVVKSEFPGTNCNCLL